MALLVRSNLSGVKRSRTGLWRFFYTQTETKLLLWKEGVLMNRKLFATVRRLNQLNQYQFAEKLGISRGLVAGIEVGNRRIMPRLENRIYSEFGAAYIEQVTELAQAGSAGYQVNKRW